VIGRGSLTGAGIGETLLRVALGSVLAFVVLAVPPVHATSIDELRTQKAAVSAKLQGVAARYESSLTKLQDNQDRISGLNTKVRRTEQKLGIAQGNLRNRARYMYRAGKSDFVQVLLGATSFEDLFTRLDFLTSIADRNATQIRDVKALRAELTSERAALKRERTALDARTRDLGALQSDLEAKLNSVKAEYERVRKELIAASASKFHGYLPPGPNGMVFPVDGPCDYTDTWGAPRSGGRSHKGTDIMASRGTPCVAVLSGTISTSSGGLGGNSIYLDADNGWRFYYAHLNDWVVASGHVKAGQLIAHVGNTGNAAGGPCHLHFQIAPSGGDWVDPYPYLRGMQ
jgi:murein DD-endopeptidase MepM/ murein hydrolase activator NlpD